MFLGLAHPAVKKGGGVFSTLSPQKKGSIFPLCTYFLLRNAGLGFGLVHFAQLPMCASFGEKDCGGAKQNGERYIQSSAVANICRCSMLASGASRNPLPSCNHS